jgi:hypothetical protein
VHDADDDVEQRERRAPAAEALRRSSSRVVRLRAPGRIRAEITQIASATVRIEGGDRPFESVRGLCKSAAQRFKRSCRFSQMRWI